MQVERHPFVPFTVIGGLEAFMEGKTFWAKRFGPSWEVVHWEGAELVCDRVIFEGDEHPEGTILEVFGKKEMEGNRFEKQ